MQFILHPQERNKLPDQVRINEEQWSSKQSVYKNHHRAAKRGTEMQRKSNPLTERMFHILVKHVKQHASQQPIKANRVCIEINYKVHPLNIEMLHCIQTAQSYFALKCDMWNNYKIEYHFCNCTYEVQLISLIQTLAIADQLVPFKIATGYLKYHNRTLQVQPERFITLL
ncbi:hypothetical protein [Pedobacter agri]|uniref:hypothetical protein n=1 Tax=Pedobacter agri TaxID=454586 RepID=UPI0029316DB6|nr:hypothetical protein [Pedobacter agri]